MQSEELTLKPAPFLGYMSWILPGIRGAVHLFLLTKHTIRHPWMTEEEQSIPMDERFSTQWDQRKFILIDDLVSGVTSWICFFQIIGAASNNVLVYNCLVFDIFLCAWRLLEESTEYEKNKLQFERDEESLKNQIKEAGAKNDNDKKTLLEEELKRLIKMKAHDELEWKYKKYGIINDIVYIVGILISFSFSSYLVIPGTLSVTQFAMFDLIGASIYFAAMTLYSVSSNVLKVYKTQEELATMEMELKTAEDMLNDVQRLDPLQENLLILEIAELQATSRYQVELIRHQKLHVLRAAVVSSMMPFILYASLPFGVGFAALLFFAVSKGAEWILDQFAPTSEGHVDNSSVKQREFKKFDKEFGEANNSHEEITKIEHIENPELEYRSIVKIP